MRISKLHGRLVSILAAAAVTALQGATAVAAPLNLPNTPLFLNGAVAPLNMLVLGRDHKLYYEAYNDHSDLDDKNDGPAGQKTLDIGYLPSKIDYYGYFDSFKCYERASSPSRWTATSTTATKTCAGANEWSGDWLNYMTTARIDALRKVLYGGKRTTDSSTMTVLERTHVPQDAHSWGKEYNGATVEGYKIDDYTPLSEPVVGTRHLFANTTLMPNPEEFWYTNNQRPSFRVALNQAGRIWNWVSKEAPVAADLGVTGTITDHSVRVEVCKTGFLESNCKRYPSGNYKPTGLLQDFGENDSMLFGLLTGSYAKSKSGGVVRKDMGTIGNEINVATDGTLTGTVGIIRTMDQFRVAGYEDYTNNAVGQGVYYTPGLVVDRPFNEGEFGGMWGNPVGEMMYEALRYFSGNTTPTAAFNYGAGSIDATAPLSLLKVDTWTNPYSGSKPACAKPFQTVMSDINVSYDTDQLPGTYFGAGISTDLPGSPNVSSLADKIWTEEYGTTSRHFIGQSAATYDGAPTPKTVSTFSNIRGLSPEEPTKEGGYYAASIAHYGLTTDVNTTKARDQKVQTFAVALASPLPRIEIPVNGRTITLVPFAKSVGDTCGSINVNGAQGAFQPTNQIVDFYVESLTATSGTFQVNFEDVESGNDHDMDAIVRYTYVVNGDGTVTITLSSDYAAGCIIHHLGYVISGTTADGIYLEVRDFDTAAGTDPNYFLDTPPGELPAALGGNAMLAGDMPWLATRTFSAGATTGATVLKDPLWYAAKWGGFKDENANDKPDQAMEWDEDNDGNPDNYFLVTNALTLGQQLTKAFDEILARVAAASSASVNSGTISSETRVYQARFNSGDWTGELLSFKVNSDGSLDKNPEWDAADVLPNYDSRTMVTLNSDGTPVRFRWDDLDATRQGQLDPASDGLGEKRASYLRGDGSIEQGAGGVFRDRPSKLGDIISSAPNFVGRPAFRYRDNLESSPYSDYRRNNENRDQVVYAGSNDGILHGFDARTGVERLAYVPGATFKKLYKLTSPTYQHEYFVDGSPNVGDAHYSSSWHTVLLSGLNRGGQGILALDITDPDDFSESDPDDVAMWEFTDADDVDLGYTFSRPQIVRMQNGRWVAVFGNGYNNTEADGAASTTGNGVLYFVDIGTGSLLRKIDTGVGFADDPLLLARPNGLATPAPVDLNGDDVVDFVYAGDLFGNLWKFDVRDSAPANWDVAYDSSGTPVPLFQAKDDSGKAQPITSRPVVGRGPTGTGMMVLFGTGKYLESDDKIVANLSTQSFYGIIDRNALTSSDVVGLRSVDLVEQEIKVEQTFTFGTETVPLRVTTANPVGTQRGWYMDLLSGSPGVPPPAGFKGEMSVSDPILRNGRVIFTTLIPNIDPCEFGGSSWLMEMEANSGARLTYTPFDNNDDGEFSDDDFVTVTIDGVAVTVPVSGKKLDNGIAQRPGILVGVAPGAENPPEYKYQPGTSGEIDITRENSGPNAQGRQSWRQVK